VAFLDVIQLIIKEFRINDEIKSATIRLIDADNEQKGIMGLDKAKQLAKEQNFDLVEVSPQAHPPVCRIMDYGKHLYKQKKIDQSHKKQQKQTEVKTIRLTIRTDNHDLETKAKQAERFLKDKQLVKVSLIFKGREITHADLGEQKLKKFIDLLEEIAQVDTPPKRQGNNLMAILSPKK
jgi:translation initiation factor IF-3